MILSSAFDHFCPGMLSDRPTS